MDEKIDLRIQKTHKKITDAFRAMMNTMSFDDITVFDLCEKANIRRATFYKHFNDKYDFLKSVIKGIINDITDTVSTEYNLSSPVEYFTRFVNEIILYFEDRPNILSNMLNSSTFPVMYDIITNCTHSSLISNLQDAKNTGIKINSDLAVTANFINGGIANLLLDWFKNPTISKDDLIKQINIILSKIFE